MMSSTERSQNKTDSYIVVIGKRTDFKINFAISYIRHSINLNLFIMKKAMWIEIGRAHV